MNRRQRDAWQGLSQVAQGCTSQTQLLEALKQSEGADEMYKPRMHRSSNIRVQKLK